MSPLFPACILAAFCILSGVSAQVRWTPASNGNVPFGAFAVGSMDGQQLFLCRANENGDLIAGNISKIFTRLKRLTCLTF